MNKMCGMFLISDLVKTLQFIGEQVNFISCIPGVKIIDGNKFLAGIKVLGLTLTVKGELLQYEISPETLILTIQIRTKTLGATIDIVTKSKVSPNGDSVLWSAEYKTSGILSFLARPLLESITESIIIDTLECVKKKLT